MTQTTRRQRDLDTVWTTEPLLKDTDDLKAYLTILDEAFAESLDVSPLEAEEARLGDRGIVMVNTEDPLCAAGDLYCQAIAIPGDGVSRSVATRRNGSRLEK